MQDFEKLGVFYLGAEVDAGTGARTGDLLLYDSKDLVTHAVCVGMTGSGKTGLCVGLLEEAALDRIPALIIDPKGDLANLLLTFPGLSASDFAPWVDEREAHGKGVTPAEYAAQQAAAWKKGLADWGQDGARIARLREAAEVRVYTPGSSAGRQLSVMKSFAPPPAEVLEDAELLRERVTGAVSGLLALAGVASDPVRGKEHILLSTILTQLWQQGASADVEALIGRVQNPGFTRVGVLDLESFFPAKDRFELAMTLNALLASPQFAGWSQGEPIDIDAMLYGPGGKPTLCVVSIAHLDDAQRMFVVTLLLTEFLAWTRRQSGTSSLRALLYMDEIAGYFPPSAVPPSKRPLLTLMKQARAFGVGVVLATQNPVDLDYKGLANAGTWFIGRLQTEQDKARLLDGLESASADAGRGVNRAALDTMLSSLGKRVFLLHNVHESEPALFQTRWTMSYLRGPMTRAQLRSALSLGEASRPAAARGEDLAGSGATGQSGDTTRAGAHGVDASAPMPRAVASAAPVDAHARGASPAPAGFSPAPAGTPPVLPPDVRQFFLPIAQGHRAAGSVRYAPMVLGLAWVHFLDKKTGVDVDRCVALVGGFADGPVAVDWDSATAAAITDKDLATDAMPGATFGEPPPAAAKARNYADWQRRLVDTLFRTQTLTLLEAPGLGLVGAEGEDERAFRIRATHLAHERRDEAVATLREKYAARLRTAQDRVFRAQQRVETQQAQAKTSGVQTAISLGAAILGGVLGRKSLGGAATTMRGAARTAQERGDVARAQEQLALAQTQLKELEDAVQEEAQELAAALDPQRMEIRTLTVRPKKTDVRPDAVVLAWAPTAQDGTALWAPPKA